MTRPIIAITANVQDDTYRLSRTYAGLVVQAGAVPLILPPRVECLGAYVGLCQGFIFSGGDDPRMEAWGIPTHPKATPLDPERQAFEMALLGALQDRPEAAVLGVCLGMQLMALGAGGSMDQHLPETLPTHAMHWGRAEHPVEGELGTGIVHSHHRQAITDPGPLRVVARAPDGIIEAVSADDRPFYLGVQWHPERTMDPALGAGLVEKLVQAAGARQPSVV